MKTGLAPLVDSHSQWLILGSFPSETSLAKQEYYGFARNQFWPLLAACFGIDGEQLSSYPEKKHFLTEHQLAVWDVYDQCERKGSLDQAIRSPQANDFPRFFARFPALKGVLLNGQKAGKEWQKQCKISPICADYPAIICPSTSPAHAQMSFETKVNVWKAAFDQLT